MKFALIASALLAVASAQQAAIVSITSPLSGSKLKAGQDCIISWVNPSVPSISQIVLARGPSTALQPVTTIAQNVDTAAGHYTWKIPYEIENGAEYAFELGTSPDLAFAGPFSIEGGVGGGITSNTSTPSTQPSTPVSSSAPSAPAAGSSSAPSVGTKPPTASSSTSPAGSSAGSHLVSSAKGVVAVAAIVIASQLL
ncbi:hypothetical protein BC940DRAFT_326217 [Gongronella butleri]|nr:hypothetical protein BC940DRAFT_326217 [Gongronella butleri]